MSNANPPPFEILEVLGEGAFGTVCVGRLTADPLRKLVALKVIKREYAANTKVINRTRDEAKLLSRLQHPNIVRVDRLLEFNGRPVVVMELVRGLDLKHLVRRQPQGFPATVALDIIRRTCLALHAAYYDAIDDGGQPLRVIHRDIKTSNLLLSVHGDLKVVDFGIATGQFGDRESFTDSLVMGSRAYMAPERLDGRPDTPAVDVYGAGMCLYELLTGRVMGLSVNPSAHDRTLARHLDALAIKGLDERGHDDLRRLLRRMCVYDVELRPTALDAAEEIAHIIEEVSPDARVSLETFAQDVVQKQYDERRRVPLQKALENVEDPELIELAAVPGARTPRPSGRQIGGLRRQPAIFIGAILGALIALSLANYQRATRHRARAPSIPTQELVPISFWFPNQVTLRVGGLSLSVPGVLRLPPGPHEADIVFEQDHDTIVCPFTAEANTAVRVVYDRDSFGISINDGPAQPCNPITHPPDKP